MNQYEIELRDKYFDRGLDAFEGARLDEAIKWANDFADECMAKRQKHLNKVNEAKPPVLAKWADFELSKFKSVMCCDAEMKYDIINNDWTCRSCKKVVNGFGKMIAEGKKIQGTECNR